jgi:hypothetical protein
MEAIKKATAAAVVSVALAVPTAAFAVEAGTTTAPTGGGAIVADASGESQGGQGEATPGVPSAVVSAPSDQGGAASSEAGATPDAAEGASTEGPTVAPAGDAGKAGEAGDAARTDESGEKGEAGEAGTAEKPVAPVDGPDAGEGSAPSDGSGSGLADAGPEGTAPGENAEQPSAIVPEGVYELYVRDGSNRKNLDVRSGSDQDAADVDVYDDNSTKAQRFRIGRVEDTEYSVIYNVGSGKVLDVANGVAAAGAKVWQYAYNGTDAQRWRVVENADGSYTLLSALRAADGGALALDVRYGLLSNGSPLQLWGANGSAAQRWYLESPRTVEDGVYGIASSLAGDRTLDISGADVATGANAQVWSTNSSAAQRFNVRYDERTGYYAIKSMVSGKVLDVCGASLESGANVWQYDENGTWAQAWSIDGLGDGSYRIVSANFGLALDVSGGRSANGTNVQQYAPNGTGAQRWILERREALREGRYAVHAGDAAFVLDDAAGSREVGANVQLWRDNGSDAQRFELVRYGDEGYYLVRNVRNGGYLTLSGDKAGANALQWLADERPGDSQLWKVVLHWDGFGLLSRSGLALDVNGASFRDGANVQGYAPNGTLAQRFWLHPAGAATLGITSVGATVTTPKGTTEQVLSSTVGGVPYLFLPSCADLTKTALTTFVPGRGGFYASATRDDAGEFVSAGSTIDLESGGFARDGDGAYRVFLRLSEGDSPLLVQVMRSANVPAVFVTSDDPILKGRGYVESSADHSLKAKGSMVLAEADGTVTYDGGLTQIKGRGNSTWLAPKKPYQIKLDKKASLVDGSEKNKSKTWLLLANAYDQSMLHQFIAAKTALAMGLGTTPDCRLVDLYYDGEYRGTYLLSEKVEVNKGRVNIEQIENGSVDDVSVEDHPTASGTNSYGREYRFVMGVKAPADLSGGYLLELDNAYYAAERSWFDTSIGHFVLKNPEDASEEQVRYISERVQAAIDAAREGNAGAGFDVSSLARVFLVEELAKNPDYIRHSSTYFYKDKGDGLVCAGPIWDFDQSFGVSPWNVGMGYEDPEGFASERYAFFLDDPAVRQQVKREFNESLRPYVEDVLLSDKDGGAGLVERTAEGIVRSASMNGLVWDGGDADDFLACAARMRDWIARRFAWMDATINAW